MHDEIPSNQHGINRRALSVIPILHICKDSIYELKGRVHKPVPVVQTQREHAVISEEVVQVHVHIVDLSQPQAVNRGRKVSQEA